MIYIGLVVVGEQTIKDFKVFCKTLEVWESTVTLYIATDKETEKSLFNIQTKNKIEIIYLPEEYNGKTRKEMENTIGKKYKTVWTDFMYEKATVLEYIFNTKETPNGVWFMDADIAHFSKLPEIPLEAGLALSPHYIRQIDCDRYGKYNGGYFWMKNKEYLEKWREAGIGARYFEQSALEDIGKLAKEKNELYEFPIQVNYGWWRMFQSNLSYTDIQAKFSFSRLDQDSTGIRYEGKQIYSVHTHWYDNTSVTGLFNQWIINYMTKFISHKPLQKVLRQLN